MSDEKPMGQVIQIDEARIRGNLCGRPRVRVDWRRRQAYAATLRRFIATAQFQGKSSSSLWMA